MVLTRSTKRLLSITKPIPKTQPRKKRKKTVLTNQADEVTTIPVTLDPLASPCGVVEESQYEEAPTAQATSQASLEIATMGNERLSQMIEEMEERIRELSTNIHQLKLSHNLLSTEVQVLKAIQTQSSRQLSHSSIREEGLRKAHLLSLQQVLLLITTYPDMLEVNRKLTETHLQSRVMWWLNATSHPDSWSNVFVMRRSQNFTLYFVLSWIEFRQMLTKSFNI